MNNFIKSQKIDKAIILKLILAFFEMARIFIYAYLFVVVTNVIFQSIIICLSFYYERVFCFALRLESPTRSLIMEAPRGVQVSAAAGDFKATCRKELHLQSTEGEVSSQGRDWTFTARVLLKLYAVTHKGLRHERT